MAPVKGRARLQLGDKVCLARDFAGEAVAALLTKEGRDPPTKRLPYPPLDARETRRIRMSRGNNRRQFLQQSAAAVGFWAAGGVTLASNRPADKIRIAGIGVGGKGHSDIEQAANHGEVVAICDIDDHHLAGAAKTLDEKGQRPKHYFDYRKMLEEMGKEIDAVVVSTPDHTHAPASLMAMKMGKHVYCQKPLTHTVHEARRMRETAKEMRVATQMGNQGTTEGGLRRAVEIIQAGVIGPVTEVHVWTNRPIWPQGADAILRVGAARTVALAALHGKMAEVKYPKPPSHVHWNEFLGTAPERPYDPIYHPFSWRGWWDYGTGALGDMACHTANMAFMALKLGYPTSVECIAVQDRNEETGPTGAKIVYQFPSREGMAPCKFTWYEGIDQNRNKYLPKKELFHGNTPPGSGSLIVGAKGILYSPDDYGAEYMFLGKDAKDLGAEAAKVDRRLPRNGKGDDGQKAEWIEAIRNGKPEIALSNFDYAAMLTETILLGNVAIRAGQGKKLEWDGPNMRITNNSDAERYLRCEYRQGWGV
jgi:predicted dehydrogenase